MITYEVLLPDSRKLMIDTDSPEGAYEIVKDLYPNFTIMEKQWVVKRCRHYVYENGECVRSE
jgi:hypothetical protein